MPDFGYLFFRIGTFLMHLHHSYGFHSCSPTRKGMSCISYIIQKLPNPGGQGTVVCKGWVEYPAWRTLEIYFKVIFFSWQTSFCRVLCLPPCRSAVLLFFWEIQVFVVFIWAVGRSWAYCILQRFCINQTSAFSRKWSWLHLLRACFPESHWFSVTFFISFNFFWSDVQVNILIICTQAGCDTNSPADVCDSGTFSLNSH